MEQERVSVYPKPNPYTKTDNFLEAFHLKNFQSSPWTYVSLVAIVLFVSQAFLGDSSELFKNMTEVIRLLTYIVTIIFLWIMYGIIYLSVKKENTTVRTVGLVKLRFIDFFRGLAILLSLFAVASVVSAGMAAFGFEMPKEVENFLPKEMFGKILWVIMSFTAGFCEETVFRGYLMTRIRVLGNFSSWTIPIIISSLLFGIPHLYQGFAGVVVISLLGALFALSYAYFKTIWPAIIAHFFLDFLNLFVPWFESLYDKMFR